MCEEWMIEAKIHFGTPWKSSLNCQILILFVFWLSSWLIIKAIWVHFWPKSNLRPVLGWHRSPLGCHKSQNMLTTALFLMQDDMKHPVEWGNVYFIYLWANPIRIIQYHHTLGTPAFKLCHFFAFNSGILYFPKNV